MLTIRSNGVWLHGIAPVGDLEYSTVWAKTGSGLLTASWSMALPIGFTHPALVQGAYVQLYESGNPIGAGIMAEPDRVNWRFTIDGLHRMAERYLAVGVTGNTLTKPNGAVFQAVNRGLPWNSPGSGVDATLPNDSLSADSEDQSQFNYLNTILNQQADLLNQVWYVDPFGTVSFQADPTTVSWLLTPGVPEMATADDDYVSTQYVRYVSAVSGSPLAPSAWGFEVATDAAAAARWGVREAGEDITNLGLAAPTFAQDTADALLADGKARPAFTEGVEVTADQITTPGGTPAYLHFVRAGQRVRQLGVLASDGSISLAGVEWVIGGTSWRSSEPSKLTLTPMGLAARNVSAVIDRLVKKAQKKMA